MLMRMLLPGPTVRHRARMLASRCSLGITPELRRHWRVPTLQGSKELEQYLAFKYLPSWYGDVDIARFLSSPDGRLDMQLHLTQRLWLDRYQFVPWISSLLPLPGARVLEIGCGTGSAVVSLAEQGASVTALDLHAEAIEATRLRCRAYKVPFTALMANARDLTSFFGLGDHDLIVFFAVLEHMTLAERRDSLQAAWRLLRPGQYLCIADTPNRLWPYDSHTSRLPFFNWLPDELAFDYSSRSPKLPFNAKFRDRSTAAMVDFVRQGRGVSYHEVEVAIGEQRVVSDQTSFVTIRNPLRLVKRLLENDSGRERWLNEFARDRHRGWFRQSINVVFRKE